MLSEIRQKMCILWAPTRRHALSGLRILRFLICRKCLIILSHWNTVGVAPPACAAFWVPWWGYFLGWGDVTHQLCFCLPDFTVLMHKNHFRKRSPVDCCNAHRFDNRTFFFFFFSSKSRNENRDWDSSFRFYAVVCGCRRRFGERTQCQQGAPWEQQHLAGRHHIPAAAS